MMTVGEFVTVLQGVRQIQLTGVLIQFLIPGSTQVAILAQLQVSPQKVVAVMSQGD
jgi:hypothetical protein